MHFIYCALRMASAPLNQRKVARKGRWHDADGVMAGVVFPGPERAPLGTTVHVVNVAMRNTTPMKAAHQGTVRGVPEKQYRPGRSWHDPRRPYKIIPNNF